MIHTSRSFKSATAQNCACSQYSRTCAGAENAVHPTEFEHVCSVCVHNIHTRIALTCQTRPTYRSVGFHRTYLPRCIRSWWNVWGFLIFPLRVGLGLQGRWLWSCANLVGKEAVRQGERVCACVRMYVCVHGVQCVYLRVCVQ